MFKNPKKVILFGVISLFFIAALNLILSNLARKTSSPSKKEVGESKQEQEVSRLTTIASNLDIPWGLAFLSDGKIIFTERPGTVKLVNLNGGELTLVAQIPEVKHIGEGGLLGIAIHPDFINNKFIYLYYTYSNNGDNTFNRVVKYKFENNKLTDEQVIVGAVPAAVNHNGGRIKFGPDGFLYITTGDVQDPSLAQNKSSLAGKILRVTDEGKPAPGNPFNNLVYSYGHRNPQGLAWDDKGRLWATEHGRSGALSGLDEINLIEAGKNYGWPLIEGEKTKEGMAAPVLNSGPSITWAPAGAAFVGNSLFFGGLRGQTLYEAVINDGRITLKEHFKGEFGRIRDIVLSPDGMLYITTSNRDGRGSPKGDDDKIIRIDPKKL